MISFEILKPFSIAAHIVYAISIILIACSLNVFAKWESKQFKDLPFLLLSWGVFCQQGSHHKIKFISTRVFVFIVSLIAVLTYNFYTSELVSRLVNVNSMDDLMESDTPIGFYNSVVIINFLNVSFELLSRLGFFL